MKRNRKTVFGYRFNGHPFLHSWSIHPVTIADLQTRIRDMEAKLADPSDPDDEKWKRRWLVRYRRELEKKQKGLAGKQLERRGWIRLPKHVAM